MNLNNYCIITNNVETAHDYVVYHRYSYEDINYLWLFI